MPSAPTGAVADDGYNCAHCIVGDLIAARTRQINSRRFQGRDLATAFANRGDAYEAKGDMDRALPNYQEALSLLSTDDPLAPDISL